MPLVVYVDQLDDKSSPLLVNPQIADLLGYTQDEWLADPDLFSNSLHPDDQEHVLGPDRQPQLVGSNDDVPRLPPDRPRRPSGLGK